jgi:LuxR family maltose regulon positive regulatory protein
VPAEVLRTKLFAPRRRGGLVARTRLLGHLTAALPDTRLVLVAAPPGWGKTTLLADWIDAVGGPRAGWVSLEPDDNDPMRFWTYVVAALRSAVPDVGSAAIEQMQVHGLDFERDILVDLINELIDLDDDVLIVLDDYHVIDNVSIHGSVAAFIEQAPPQIHLAMTTRSDPPLPLPRLRARGQLVEIRAEQLRFSAEEGASLLNDVLSLALSSEDVTKLLDRTEGWVVGLQLAGLTLQDRSDVEAFITQFAGNDRHIVDYLGAEVLDRQTHDIREFLLRTSVLNRISAPLCQAVTLDDQAPMLLSAVEQANLFLMPLDHSREWFRYHHLFGDLLRHQLLRESPDVVSELHRRAALWYDTVDSGEAVAHAAAAGDDDLLADILRRHWRPVFNTGQLTAVDRWLDLLPGDRVAADPELTLARVWVALDQGRLEEADSWFKNAERSHADDGQLRLMHALLAFKHGGLSHARMVLEEIGEPGDSPFWGAVGACLAGITAYWSGDRKEALPALERATQRAVDDGNVLATTYSMGYRALVLADDDPEAAEALLDEIRTVTESESVRDHFVTMMPALAAHRLALSSGDAAAAASSAERALELAQRGAGRIERAAALSATGQCDAARALVEQCADPGPLIVEMIGQQRRTTSAGRPINAGLVEQLTQRELTILRLLTGTASNREIAAELFVSPNTLKTHLRAIYRKLDVSDRIAAVQRGRALGLLPGRVSAVDD